MSTRKSLSTRVFTLPGDASWLEFERSDGDPSTWPAEVRTERVVDKDGHVNFYRIIDLEESQGVRWRMEVGSAVAKQMNMPDGPEYVLKSWPSGYQLYDHNKGPHADPRHDLYLFGPKGIRFRSINEFIPHAFWLMNPTARCACKYCSKRPQREISFALGLSKPGSTPSMSPGPGRVKSRPGAYKMSERTPRESRMHELYKPYAAMQRVPIPTSDRSISSKGTTYNMVIDRNNDLRAVISRTEMRLKRWFRKGELLWCALENPIRGQTREADIIFWPGLVQETIMKPEAIPRPANDTGGPSGDNSLNPSAEPAPTSGDSESPWTVRQSTMYKIKFLAVHHASVYADHQVLPYQAYIMDEELRRAMETFPLENLDINPDVIRNFDPRTPPETPSADAYHRERFENAVGPYVVAIQAAAYISNYWFPTNEWEFRYKVSTPKPPSQPATTTMTGSISTDNAAMDVSTNTQSHGADTQEDIAKRLLGQTPGSLMTSQNHTQLRYQGIWWGAERIWTSELVRLKIARRQLAPRGGPDIYPAAGPSQSAIEYSERLAGVYGMDSEGVDYGAEARGLFMKMDGLFVVSLPGEDGQMPKKECRVSGMLYELADVDWVDPLDSVDNPSAQASESEAALKPPPANSQLSQPATASSTQLPAPPTGFKFRPILSPGCEAVMSLTLISGRYYPGLLSHPLLQPYIEHAIASNNESGGLQEAQHLWSLEGLSPGVYNAVDPTRAKPDRNAMVEEAEKNALEELGRTRETFIAARDRERNGVVPKIEDDDMDVDQLTEEP